MMITTSGATARSRPFSIVSAWKTASSCCGSSVSGLVRNCGACAVPMAATISPMLPPSAVGALLAAPCYVGRSRSRTDTASAGPAASRWPAACPCGASPPELPFLSTQHSALSTQHSALSTQHSALGGAMQHYGLFIGGAETEGAGGERMPVIYPYTGEAFATVSVAAPADVDRAVGAAQAAFRDHLRAMPAHERARLLMRTAEAIGDHRAEFTDAIAREAGKPLKDVAIEAGRGGELFVMAAGETRDIVGELLPMDAIRGGEGRWGMVLRQPLGVVAAIGPFNAPLNLVAQKVAPALAAGNSVVVKPASKTPIAAVLLARCIHEAGWPAGTCNVVIGPGGTVGDPLVADPRVRMVSFTGGTEVGARIRERAEI